MYNTADTETIIDEPSADYKSPERRNSQHTNTDSQGLGVSEKEGAGASDQAQDPQEATDKREDSTGASEPITPKRSSSNAVNFIFEWAAVLICVSSMLFTQVGIGAYLVITKEFIAATFNIEGNAGQQSWIIAAHSLTVGTFVLPAGRLGDMFGNKKILCIGFLWYSIWSMVTGLTVYTRSIIFFRCLQSIAGDSSRLDAPERGGDYRAHVSTWCEEGHLVCAFRSICAEWICIWSVICGSNGLMYSTPLTHTTE